MEYSRFENNLAGASAARKDCATVTVAGQTMGRITEAHEAARKLAEFLHNEISLLEARLSPVLRPQMPIGGNGAEKARNEPSALGASLEQLNAAISEAINRVQNISGRVDL